MVAAAALVVLVGRNDGSPLAALAQHTSRSRGGWAPVLVTAALPVMPLLGVRHVAEALEALAAGPASSDAGLLAFLLAVLVTVALSVALAVPSSITLAMVGALAGTALGSGEPADWRGILRVLVLAAVAPLLAVAAAWALSRLPLRLRTAEHTPTVLSLARKLVYGGLVVAYSANDGQKVLVAAALVYSATLTEAATSALVVGTSTALFGLGVAVGLRPSGRALRHGASSPGPVQALWSQTAAAAVVGAGSALGAPLSMTQALVGGVVGAGLARGSAAVRWAPVARIGIAWLWSLPLSTLLAAGTTLALTL